VVDLTVPLTVVTPTLDAAVLQALAATTSWASGAQVHRTAGTGSADGVRKVLIRLAGQGIVHAQDQPPATLYRLNRDHVAAGAVVALTRLRQVIIDRITAEIAAWDPPLLHASLFGSFARGDADSDSDIDLLLIPTGEDAAGSGLEEATARLAKDVYAWTGNRAHIVTPTLTVVAAMLAAGDPLVESWRVEQVHLAGARLSDVLRRAS
jgi:predicted nucleotidyltransferase